MLTQVKKSSAEVGLYLHLKKTKVMATEQIDYFLGSKIVDNGTFHEEIRSN